MNAQGKIIAGLAIALLASIGALLDGYHYHKTTVEQLTTRIEELSSVNTLSSKTIGILNEQLTDLKTSLTEKQHELDLATQTTRHEVIVRNGTTTTTTIDVDRDTEEKSTSQLLSTVTDQLVAVQAKLDAAEVSATAATNEVRTLQQQLTEKTVDVSKAGYRWQFGADLDPKLVGIPINLSNPAFRISAAALIGPFAIGLDAAPALNLGDVDPRLVLRFSL